MDLSCDSGEKVDMKQFIEVEGISFTIEQSADGTYFYSAPDGQGFASKCSVKWEKNTEDHRRAIVAYLRMIEDD